MAKKNRDNPFPAPKPPKPGKASTARDLPRPKVDAGMTPPLPRPEDAQRVADLLAPFDNPALAGPGVSPTPAAPAPEEDSPAPADVPAERLSELLASAAAQPPQLIKDEEFDEMDDRPLEAAPPRRSPLAAPGEAPASVGSPATAAPRDSAGDGEIAPKLDRIIDLLERLVENAEDADPSGGSGPVADLGGPLA